MINKYKCIQYKDIDEKEYQMTLSNGLLVTVIPKKGFKKFNCALQVNFGSKVRNFTANCKEYNIPGGIAHFLEHKLFTLEDGTDAANLFQEIGLECNAYTDFSNTVFYFSGQKNLSIGIEMLLDFIQKPFFTKESIEKEKGIIMQEIKMYQDIPGERSHYGLLENMFETYPIKYDVCGTISDLTNITEELLYECHSLFYNPGNMNLVIVGDVNEEEVFSVIKENQNKKSFPKKQDIVLLFEQDNNIKYKYREITMDVSETKCEVGFKLPSQSKSFNSIEFEIKMNFLCNMLFGSSSRFYQKLLDDGIVNDLLALDLYIDSYGGYVSISADTVNPKEFIKRIIKRVNLSKKRKFSERDFQKNLSTFYGSTIKNLNSIELITTNYLEYKSRKENYFDAFNIFRSLSLEDVKKMRDLLDVKSLTAFVIKPLE